MNDLDTYIGTIFDGLEGYVYSPVKTNSDWVPNWFQYPQDRDQLLNHIRTAVGDVYVSPVVYKERRATKDSIKKGQTFWVEFDGLDKINFNNCPRPTMIVQTSFASHVHCYWRTGNNNQGTIEEVNRRLTYYLQADSSGWDATQLLRPPETTNHKHNLPVVLAHHNETTFLQEHFSTIPTVAAPASSVLTVTDLIPPGQILQAHQLPLKLVRMVRKEAPNEPYRSSFIFRVANELAEEDLTHVEIVSLLKEVDGRIKKYEGRSDQLLRLSQIADFAIHKHLAEEEILIYTPEYILNYVEELTWILPSWLHTTGQLMLSSAPGIGKSQLGFQLAYCLTVGERFLGMLAPNKHRVFYMSLEMDKSGIKYILTHQKNQWSCMPQFQMIDEPSTLVKYEDMIDENDVTVVIIDSLSELFDESADNMNSDAKRIMRWTKKIRRRYGVALVIIHHNRKATEGNKKPKSLDDLAYSFDFGRVSDTVLMLWEDLKGIELSAVKCRYGPKSAFMINRNEHLWFTRKDSLDASKDPGPDKPDKRPDKPFKDNWS
jgi:hypothetical protein